jgi:5-formaminoimidazole-4-carboxamide-1-beta-D-ribofuranosyl 5'-monophosphate synthetase
MGIRDLPGVLLDSVKRRRLQSEIEALMRKIPPGKQIAINCPEELVVSGEGATAVREKNPKRAYFEVVVRDFIARNPQFSAIFGRGSIDVAHTQWMETKVNGDSSGGMRQNVTEGVFVIGSDRYMKGR